MSEAARLAALASWLGSAVGEVYAAALAIDEPAGSNPDWLALLGRYGVPAISVEDRRRAKETLGMLRGAPADELYELLQAIARSGREALGPWRFDDAEVERTHERLRRKLEELAQETLRHYKRMVLPASSMFAGALSSARAGQGAIATSRPSRVHLQRCQRCGAPRLGTSDLDCVYCGAALVGGG